MLPLLLVSVLIGVAQSAVPAPIGLRNLGLTCFMNSVTQNIYGLLSVKKEIIEAAKVKDDSPEFTFASVLARLDERKNGPVDIAPDFFKTLKRIENTLLFQPSKQDDAQVYFNWLVGSVFPPNTRKYMQSTVTTSSNFEGVTYKTLLESEPTYRLSIDPKQGPIDLENALKNPYDEVMHEISISTPEDCDDKCMNTMGIIQSLGANIDQGVNKITRSSKLTKTSEILTIQVLTNKAVPDAGTKITQGAGGAVNYKHEMKVLNETYHLNGIVYHRGTTKHGHYIAKVKDHLTGKWFNLDDSSVSECSKQDVLAHSEGVYLLFYINDALNAQWSYGQEFFRPSVPEQVIEANKLIRLASNTNNNNNGSGNGSGNSNQPKPDPEPSKPVVSSPSTITPNDIKNLEKPKEDATFLVRHKMLIIYSGAGLCGTILIVIGVAIYFKKRSVQKMSTIV